MSSHVVRTFVLVAVTSLAVVACGPADIGASRLKEIPENTTRDSVLQVMGTGPLTATGADTMRVVNGFRRQTFVVGSGTYEVLFYREQPGSVTDTIARTLETPVVIKDGKYLGQGWKFYTKLADSEDLPNPLRNKERLDSISRAQTPK
jgi:hypothetical protein